MVGVGKKIKKKGRIDISNPVPQESPMHLSHFLMQVGSLAFHNQCTFILFVHYPIPRGSVPLAAQIFFRMHAMLTSIRNRYITKDVGPVGPSSSTILIFSPSAQPLSQILRPQQRQLLFQVHSVK